MAMTDKTPPFGRVTKRYDASPERVFDAWLDTAMIGKFLFGPALREETILSLSIDARVGGAFSFVVQRKDMTLDHTGTYLEIDRPRRLVFTWGVRGDDAVGKVIIAIKALEMGCELTLTHEMAPGWEDFAPRVEEAWTKMLNALGTAL
jgi:uncharacterized protein YndB with AHSA1/START domain